MLALSCKANWLFPAKIESAPFAEQSRAFRKNIWAVLALFLAGTAANHKEFH